MIPNVLGDSIVRPLAKTMPPSALRILTLVHSSSQQIQWSSAVHEHGDRRVREHFDCLSSEDYRRDTSTTVRSHNNQIALSGVSGIDDCLIDLSVLDVQHLAGDT